MPEKVPGGIINFTPIILKKTLNTTFGKLIEVNKHAR
jgi:hypothetical protein